MNFNMKYAGIFPILPYGALAIIMSDGIFFSFFFLKKYLLETVLCGADRGSLNGRVISPSLFLAFL